MAGRLSPALEALRDEALQTNSADWARRQGWPLKRNGVNMTGPCPRCGGDDRFSIHKPTGKWNCRGCCVGGHDVISLVSHSEGRKFADACERITGRAPADKIDPKKADEIKRQASMARELQKIDAEQYRQKARRDAHQIWKRSDPCGMIVENYLAIRNLRVDRLLLRKSVRQIAKLDYWHNQRTVYTGPAMIAAIQLSNGHFGGVHRTWIDLEQDKGKIVLADPDGAIDKKTGNVKILDAKKTMGTKGDGAIRLVTPGKCQTLIMGEGIETTLTPYLHARQPHTAYWCGIDLGHIAGRARRDADGKIMRDEPDMDDDRSFKIPDDLASGIYELILLGDSDSDNAITRSAMTRGARRQKRLRPQLKVCVAWPDLKGDFNDMVMENG